MSKAWRILGHAVRDFIADDVMSLGAALAFYTALSMAPLLVLVLALAGFLWQESEVRAELLRQAHALVGPSGAEAVRTVMEAAGGQDAQGLAAIVGAATLLFGATSAFAQLQYSLNRVWNVETRPGRDVSDFVRKRLLSLAMILLISLLLVASLVASAALRLLRATAQEALPGLAGLSPLLAFLASLLVYTGIFTLVHHTLPDVKMPWIDSLVGGAITALLFAVGKELLAVYLGSTTVTSAYGAAGSFFAVLVWVYYSSLILFVGAELTQAFAGELGHPVTPDRNARFTRTANDGRAAG